MLHKGLIECSANHCGPFHDSRRENERHRTHSRQYSNSGFLCTRLTVFVFIDAFWAISNQKCFYSECGFISVVLFERKREEERRRRGILAVVVERLVECGRQFLGKTTSVLEFCFMLHTVQDSRPF